MDLTWYVTHGCDHLTDILALEEPFETKIEKLLTRVKKLKSMPIPASYEVTYLEDLNFGTVIFGSGDIGDYPAAEATRGQFSEKVGRLLFRRWKSAYNPQSFDIWWIDEDQNFLTTDTMVCDVEDLGDWKAYYPYHKVAYRLSYEVISRTDKQRLEEMLRKAMFLKKNGYSPSGS